MAADRVESLERDLRERNADYEAAVQAIETGNIRVEDMKLMISEYDRTLVSEKEAKDLISKIQNGFDRLDEELYNIDLKSAAYLIWKDPYMVAANNTFINHILTRSKFTNVFIELNRYPEITLDLIVGVRLCFLRDLKKMHLLLIL